MLYNVERVYECLQIITLAHSGRERVIIRRCQHLTPFECQSIREKSPYDGDDDDIENTFVFLQPSAECCAITKEANKSLWELCEATKVIAFQRIY